MTKTASAVEPGPNLAPASKRKHNCIKRNRNAMKCVLTGGDVCRVLAGESCHYNFLKVSSERYVTDTNKDRQRIAVREVKGKNENGAQRECKTGNSQIGRHFKLDDHSG